MKSREYFEKAYGFGISKKMHTELLAMLICLEFIDAFSFFGYINIPPISITTLHIIVIVAAMYFGPLDAAAVSLVFAGTSVWTASAASYEEGDIIFSPWLSGKPAASIVMAVGARVVFALAAGYMFRVFFAKERKHRLLGIAGISVAATLLHSALIYVCMAGFFGAAGTDPGTSFWQSLLVNNLILLFVTVVTVLLFDFIMLRTKKTGNSFSGVYMFVIIILILLFASSIIAQSGIFTAKPSVQAKANNCYDDTLYVITDEDYRPYSFYDEKGEFSGHDVELIALIANEMNMNLDLKFLPWDEAITEADNGRTDVLMTCDYSDSFSGVDLLIKSEPVSTDEFIVFSKTEISSVDELYGKICAVMENGNVLPQIKMLNLDERCVKYSDNREAMTALEKGEADCAIMRYTVGEALLSELKYRDIKGTVSIGQSYMCFGITGENTELRDRINSAIETLKVNGDVRRLQNKWLTTFIHKYTLSELVLNNSGQIAVIMLLIVAILLSSIRNEHSLQRSEDEKKQYIEIIENLANDFECVNYVEITDGRLNDKAVLLRTSDILVRNIPGWETETNFVKRYESFFNYAVAPEDREEFHEKTSKETILSNLEENDSYFVNFKAILDGEPCYYQLKVSTVKNEQGEITALVMGIHDIDAETKKEIADMEALQAARSAAEAANKSKTDFLFSMSHDIRTPMNAISGFTNMAIKYIDNKEKALDSLEKTKKAGGMLLSLINSVLEVSRIESGNASVEEKPGDVTLSFVNIENTMLELAEEKDINLSFEFGEIKNRYVYADFTRCMRIFVNVISNAVKYTPEGGTVRVRCEEIESEKEGYGTYRYTVADNGIGMSEEFQKHIFEQFTREQNSTVSGIQGTGLGMSVVKSFADLMGGTVSVKSRQGEGSVFTIILPFRLQEGEEYTDPSTGRVVKAGQQIENAEEKDFSGRRVLLVEDNEMNREIAADILSEAGLVADEADDGTTAVEMLKEKGPYFYDFILMDIQMPKMNGYDATRAIRAMYPDVHIPVIALSANAFSEDKAASLAAGMDDHVAKPININELFASLGSFL